MPRDLLTSVMLIFSPEYMRSLSSSTPRILTCGNGKGIRKGEGEKIERQRHVREGNEEGGEVRREVGEKS